MGKFPKPHLFKNTNQSKPIYKVWYIFHKSQIGFLANNHTADHVLTLRTLMR